VNVAVRTLAEICLVGSLRVLVPIARKHALAARSLEGNAKATDAAKQINETK
jgi:hypothetical protein